MQSINAIVAKRMVLSKIHLSPTVICSFIYEELRHSRPLKAPGGEGDESCTFSSVRNIFLHFYNTWYSTNMFAVFIIVL